MQIKKTPTRKKLWKVLDSRAVVPVTVDEINMLKHPSSDSNAEGTTASGQFIAYGFTTKKDAVERARQLIDKSEIQAKAQLLNCEKHRIRLEQSIKEHDE